MAVVRIAKPLGVELEERDARGTSISAFTSGGHAQDHGGLAVGDWVLAVDGSDVSTEALEAVLEVISASDSPVVLTVARPLTVGLGKPLGLELADRPGDDIVGCYVSEVQDGCADECGLINKGDVVLAVNGNDATTADCETVAEWVTEAEEPVQFSVLRVPHRTHPPIDRCAEVRLPLPLGLEIKDCCGGGVVISKVFPESFIQMHGVVRSGDRFLEVEGEDVTRMNVDAILELISACEGQVSVRVGKPSPPTN